MRLKDKLNKYEASHNGGAHGGGKSNAGLSGPETDRGMDVNNICR